MNRILLTTVGSLLLITIISCSSQAKISKFKDSYGNPYRYELELTGTLSNSNTKSKFVILTNDPDLTFNEVSKSMFSSTETSADFYLLSYDVINN